MLKFKYQSVAVVAAIMLVVGGLVVSLIGAVDAQAQANVPAVPRTITVVGD